MTNRIAVSRVQDGEVTNLCEATEDIIIYLASIGNNE